MWEFIHWPYVKEFFFFGNWQLCVKVWHFNNPDRKMALGNLKRKAMDMLDSLLSARIQEKLEQEQKREQRHKLVGPPKLWRQKRDFQIRFLKKHGLKPQHKLIDLGCGTLRGGIPLIDYLQKGHYYGLEVREETLEEGRKELAEAWLEHKEPALLSSPDVATIDLGETFEYIWAFSVLVHMNDTILDGALGFVAKHLAKDGVFYVNVGLGEAPERKWQSFPVVRRPLEFYEDARLKHGLACEDLGLLSSFGDVKAHKGKGFQHMLKITPKRG